ncbi:dimethyladenosine synthase, putative [Eimeria tenella]|uniref:rRNA adenine N(6)-methyltransferase n=1 Tax=Eimeria tenella TaxID=5802 RepID=U6L3L5_EIMTE|nr:dimethyladenosine synthase, putative [Eimeria tenella]CDJ44761.1 dimethyladenosine synthase, putative [Eimeria tenella]|eukprot:XP_013235509.1 dimethyladenosine synthase, putative [Eimeria tenella]
MGPLGGSLLRFWVALGAAAVLPSDVCSSQQQQQQQLPPLPSFLSPTAPLCTGGPSPPLGGPWGPSKRSWGPPSGGPPTQQLLWRSPLGGSPERAPSGAPAGGPSGEGVPGGPHRGPPAGKLGGPPGALRPALRPWDNLEIFPLEEEAPELEAPAATVHGAGGPLRGAPVPLGGPPRAPTARLPRGEFRPKQSLGQNFLADSNICRRIVKAFKAAVAAADLREQQQQQQQQQQQGGSRSSRVVEVGPGTGALTRLLYPLFPDMLAVEIDPRAISLLSQRLPGLQMLHEDVLQVNWPYLAHHMNRLRIVGNLPFYLTSQLLFCLLDCRQYIDLAVVTLQKEVAEVESAVVLVEFRHESDEEILGGVSARDLKKVLFAAFGQRRKMLRQSLKVSSCAGL